MSDILKVDHLTLRRGNFLLEDVSLSVGEQEIVALIGKTGAGKTVLLETVAGFNRPDSGSVLYQGREISSIPIEQRNIGYLYQDYSLFPHMTAEKNIVYSLKMQRCPKEEIQKRVFEMGKRFGITGILKQYPGTLSGGEQQRVALARALMMRPSLLILDEPFSALDPVTKKRLYGMLRQIREEFHCAILFVTHDFQEAQELADRIGVLIDGRLQGIVSSGDLFTAEWKEDVRDFLGLDERGEENQ